MLPPIDYNKIIFFDFETYSESPISVGGYNYTNHRSAEVLCLCYKFYGKPTKTYFPLRPRQYLKMPDDLFYAAKNDYTFVAHNVFFDFCAWNNILYRTMGNKWPVQLMPEQVFDTQTLAQICGLPAKLEYLANALGLGSKDEKGDDLIKLMSSPRKPTKADARNRVFDWDHLLQMVDYCKRDVELLELIWDKLPRISKESYRVWYETFKTNTLGINVDLETAKSVVVLRDKFVKRRTKELREFTNEKIQTGGQVGLFKEYLKDVFDIELESLTKDWVLKQLRNNDIDPKLKKLLEFRRDLGKNSFAKFDQMLKLSDDNGVLRDIICYHGASTGRWTSYGMQIHNMLRHNFKGDLQKIAELIHTEDDKVFQAFYNDPMLELAAFIRPCIWTCGTNTMYCADLSQIEARMVFYLSGQRDALDAFASGADLYKGLASTIYGMPIDEIGKDSEERFIGKTGILSSGYAAGGKKFCNSVRQKTDINMQRLGKDLIVRRLQNNSFDLLSFCRAFYNAFFPKEKHKKAYIKFIDAYNNYGLDVLDNIKTDFGIAAGNLIIKTYRDKYPKVPILWKTYEKAAIEALVRNEQVDVWPISFIPKPKENRFCVRLPSGRLLTYWKPHVKQVTNKFGKEQIQFRFYGVDQRTKRYVLQAMHGGIWTENIDQAICNDVLTHSILNLIDAGYRFLFSVHDETIHTKQNGSFEEFMEIMNRKPPWLADYFPLASEGWTGDRYHK